MKFLSMGEKVQKLREQLKLTQDELQTEKVTRGLISMIETGRREVTYNTAVRLAEQFSKKAEELNIILNIDEGYLMRSPSEDAEIYCLNKLKNDDITENTIKEIFELIEQYDLLFVQAKTYFKIGQINEKNKHYDDACMKYDDAIKIYKAMGKDENLGQVYLRMCTCKGNNLQYDTAIVFFNLSHYYAFAYDDKEIQRMSLYDLAVEYKKINKLDLALETVEKYLAISDESHPFYFYGHGIKATCYEFMGDYDKAIDTYKDLITKSSNNQNIFLGYFYNNLGLNYCHKNDFKESLKYFEMAEQFKNELDKKTLSHSIIEKSIVFLKQELYTDAIKTIELGLKYATEYKDMEYLLKGNYMLVDIYDKLNDTENLEKVYLELIELLRDSDDKNNLKSTYDKISLMYLNDNKSALCKKYLLLSNALN